VTQAGRLYAYLIANPGASSLEIQQAMRITNATGRISDLRSKGEVEGFAVIREKRSDGRDGYRIVSTTELTLGLTA
jgi:hypothetical protein